MILRPCARGANLYFPTNYVSASSRERTLTALGFAAHCYGDLGVGKYDPVLRVG